MDKDVAETEIGKHAVWSLSTAKTGSGVQQLRDNNLDTFWQYVNFQQPNDCLKDLMDHNRIILIYNFTK
jgi:hypothetical protein